MVRRKRVSKGNRLPRNASEVLKQRWEELKAAVFNRRMAVCIFIGFASGLPLYYLIQFVPGWLREGNVDLKTIGLFALVGLPYTYKFVWSPFMDRYVPPFLGRRRGWMLVTQLLMIASICGMAFLDPRSQVGWIAYLCFIIAFLSSSQDIVIDAYRREILPDRELGVGNTIHVQFYRVAGIFSGNGLAFIVVGQLDWRAGHFFIAACLGIAVLTTFFISEPQTRVPPPRSLREAIVDPFREFIERGGKQSALEFLAFLFLYKLGDNLATALSTPFYLDLGFTTNEIGVIAKSVSFWSAAIGGVLGGVVMVWIGINRSLWCFGVVQILSILGFAVLSEVGNDPWVLSLVLAFEYLGVGLGTAAFTAFVARAASMKFTATQLALFTSFLGFPRTFANASTGYLVEALGWTPFFLFCTLSSLPGMLLLMRVAPWREK